MNNIIITALPILIGLAALGYISYRIFLIVHGCEAGTAFGFASGAILVGSIWYAVSTRT